MSRTPEDILEFDRLRDLLRGRTTCAAGRGVVDALSFSQDRSALDAVFALIAEGIAYLGDGSEMGFGSLPDPARWLAELAAPVAVLTPLMLIDAAALADTTAMLRDAFREAGRGGSGLTARQFPLLSARAGSVADLRPLAVNIRRAVLPNGEISDDASPELRRIRASMGRTRETIQKTLEHMLRTRGGDAGESYVTLRNDRFVIPVRAAERRQVQGVVHAASATGQTVFVEPFETVEHNNRLVQLAEEEAEEIARILAELTDKLRGNLGPLLFAVETIAELDSVFARARFARDFDCTLPQFTNEIPTEDFASAAPSLELKDARHPVLADTLRSHGRAVVPMTLALVSRVAGRRNAIVFTSPWKGRSPREAWRVGVSARAARCESLHRRAPHPASLRAATLPLQGRAKRTSLCPGYFLGLLFLPPLALRALVLRGLALGGLALGGLVLRALVLGTLALRGLAAAAPVMAAVETGCCLARSVRNASNCSTASRPCAPGEGSAGWAARVPRRFGSLICVAR